MPTLRIEKNRNYTVMSNYHLRDKRLKLKTIGLMSIMLSLPEDWDFSVKGLSTICNDGRTSVEAALKELEVYGYLTRNYLRAENGSWADIEYILREYPIAENPISADLHQINTDLNKYRMEDGETRAKFRKPESGYVSSSQTLTEGERNPSPSCGAPPPRDPAYAEVSAEYQRNFGLQPMGVISDILSDGIKDTCKEAVIYAIHSAKAAMAKNPYRYAEKVIHSMIAAGVVDAAGVEAYKAAHETCTVNKAPARKGKTLDELLAEAEAEENGNV